MSTIPLPALHVQPPQQQESPVEGYARLLQLRNMMQNAPLQQQALQQQVQAGQLDNQIKAQQIKDQQALSDAMHEWSQPTTTQGQSTPQGGQSSMPNYDDLITLAKKNGASFNAIQGIQKMVLDMKEKASTIAKNDAQTGSNNANALKTKNGMLIDAMSGIMNLPDDQIVPGLLSGAQELSAKGLLDPQHVQLAQQLAQTGDPAVIRKQLTAQIAGLGGWNKLIEDQQKKVQLENEKGKTDPNSPLYSPSAAAVAMGTAPGAAQIQQGEVKQASRKAAAEAAARQPYQLALQSQEQALRQGDPNAAGQLLVNGDATLSELKSRGATPDFIAKALNAAHQLSGGKYNAQAAEAQFDVAKSPTNVAFFGSAKSLTAPGGTLDQLAQAAKDLPGGKIPAFNSIADWEKAATGSGPIAKYASIALGVADDYAKVMGGGQGSDTSRAQALNLIGAKQSPEQRAGSIEGIRGAVGSQIEHRIGANPVLKRMYGSDTQASSTGNAPKVGDVKTFPNGRQGKWDGKGWVAQ